LPVVVQQKERTDGTQIIESAGRQDRQSSSTHWPSKLKRCCTCSLNLRFRTYRPAT